MDTEQVSTSLQGSTQSSVHDNARRAATRAQGLRYAAALAAVIFCTAAGYRLRGLFSEADIIVLFLVGAVAVAAALGRGPALLYAAGSVSAFNYFFVEPVFTFSVANPSYWLTFAVMFLACVVIATLASQLRDQVALARRREHEALMLYELMKELAAPGAREGMSRAFIRWIAEAMAVEAEIVYPDGTRFESAPARGQVDADFPIKGSTGTLGLVKIRGTETLEPDRRVMMETFVGLLGSSLERAATAAAAEQARMLAEKEKLRNILLRSVSHDLRTPLAAISGAAETLLQERDHSLLRSIRQESARLSRIVGNLLDITRIEGGNLKLNLRAYDPAEIIGSAVEASREALHAHQLSLHVANDLPFVRMDGLLISQVLQNLLENAAVHTPAGTAVTLTAESDGEGLRLAVEDEGPGIPAGAESAIFEKFSTYARGDLHKGTGLGLAICQAVMLAHQGSIRAENRPGGGCRVTVAFPAAATLPPAVSENK
jgi:two-component system sensor histidine kinase KdpD